MQLNASVLPLIADMVARADALGIAWHASTGGTRIGDCGVQAAGGTDAGVMLAKVAMAGLATVDIEPPGLHAAAFAAVWPGCEWPVVAVATRDPVAACLASQYAGWKVSAGGFFALASGPVRAAIGREAIYDCIGLRERAPEAVGILETARIPPDEICRDLAAAAGVAPDRLVLLVARTASVAGTLQVVARSLETALHKLHDLRFDLTRIRSGSGRAPLAPVPGTDDLTAIGRTNDAILYGGHVTLEVTGDDASLVDFGPRMVSNASPDFGRPFADLFERAGRDFYAIDPALFAPAIVELVNVDTGRRHRFGCVAPKIVRGSFTTGSGGRNDRRP